MKWELSVHDMYMSCTISVDDMSDVRTNRSRLTSGAVPTTPTPPSGSQSPPTIPPLFRIPPRRPIAAAPSQPPPIACTAVINRQSCRRQAQHKNTCIGKTKQKTKKKTKTTTPLCRGHIPNPSPMELSTRLVPQSLVGTNHSN